MIQLDYRVSTSCTFLNFEKSAIIVKYLREMNVAVSSGFYIT